jgi:hypothetical protein
MLKCVREIYKRPLSDEHKDNTRWSGHTFALNREAVGRSVFELFSDYFSTP